MIGTLFSWKPPKDGQPTVMVSNPYKNQTRIIMWPLEIKSKQPHFDMYSFEDPNNENQKCYAVTGEIEIQTEDDYCARTNQIGAKIRKIFKTNNNPVTINIVTKNEFSCQPIYAYRGYSKKQARESAVQKRQTQNPETETMTIEKIRCMSDEDLFQLTLKRYPVKSKFHGTYTKEALLAQQVYCERNGVIGTGKYSICIDGYSIKTKHTNNNEE